MVESPKPVSAEDIQGWMFADELVWLSKMAAECQSIAEIGCWKGRSTFALLSACPGTVYAIDHFRGSADTPAHAEALDGSVRREFMRNCGDFPNLRIIERDSVDAAQMFGTHGLDMVFIDGSHSYQDVSADICAWFPKARRIIAGHDYNLTSWPGVVKAVNEIFTRDLQFAAQSIWFYEVGR